MVSLISLFWFSGGILAALFDRRLSRQNSEALQQLQQAHETLEKSAREMAVTMTRDLRESEHRVRAVIEGALDCIIMMDVDGNITEFNQAAERTFGYKRKQVIGKNLAEMIIPSLLREKYNAGLNRFYKTGKSALLGKYTEMSAMRADGSEFPIELNLSEINWSGTQTLAVFLRDITKRKLAEAEIQNLAFYDPLTKLPNRRLLRERLQHSMAMWARNKVFGVIFFMDIDNFKSLNDTQGHSAGDLLLVEVAARLQSCVRGEDTVARLSGDEFIVVMGGLSSEAKQAAGQAAMMGEKIRESLGQPYVFSGFSHHGSASIGAVMFLNHDLSIDELLKRADAAMYQAKQSGGNKVQFFDPLIQSAATTGSHL